MSSFAPLPIVTSDAGRERRCRKVIAKMGDHLHKEGSRYWIEFDISHCVGHSEFTQRPADEDSYRWNTLEEIVDYCARMEEKNGKN